MRTWTSVSDGCFRLCRRGGVREQLCGRKPAREQVRLTESVTDPEFKLSVFSEMENTWGVSPHLRLNKHRFSVNLLSEIGPRLIVIYILTQRELSIFGEVWKLFWITGVDQRSDIIIHLKILVPDLLYESSSTNLCTPLQMWVCCALLAV